MAAAHTFDQVDHVAAFELLTKDFLVACEYIEPVDANLGVYSHRLYELLLRAATEFEALSRELLNVDSAERASRRSDIRDYVAALGHRGLLEVEVGFLMWRPITSHVRPFHGSPSPPWYRAYNQSKHNRSGAFRDACLDGVRHAIAGVYAALYATHLVSPTRVRTWTAGARYETRYEEHPFTIAVHSNDGA